MWVLFFIIPFKLSIKIFDLGIPFTLFVPANLMRVEYIKASISSAKSILTNFLGITTL